MPDKYGLTSDEMLELANDSAMGRPSRLTDPASIAFRQKVDGEVTAIAKKGEIVQIPHEHPDISDFGG